MKPEGLQISWNNLRCRGRAGECENTERMDTYFDKR